MKYTKLTRIKDNTTWYKVTLEDEFEFLASNSKRITKPLSYVKDFEDRFREV